VSTPPSPPPPSTPPPCTMSFSKTNDSFGYLGGGGGFTLTTGDSCSWAAGSNADWLTISSSSLSGTGSRTISFSVAGNNSNNTRTGIIYSGSRSLTVTQAAKASKFADLNGDGLNDLIWQNHMTGELAVWHMNGVNIKSGNALAPGNVGDSNWKIMGAFDANLDGQTDILFQHDAGYVVIWRMAGDSLMETVVLSESVVADPRWRIAGTGDLDRDGFTDIFWQHPNGQVAVWYLYGNGFQVRSGAIFAAVSDTAWKVGGFEDFNRDGKLDILWRHAGTGDMTMWFMDHTQFLGSAAVTMTVSNMQWQIASIADFSGDGKPDLVWRNSITGELAAWFLDGGTVLNGWSLNPGRVADLNWRVTGAR
jgi:hypothetical protein